MVQTRHPQERCPPASLDFVDSPIAIKSGKKGGSTKKEAKKGNKNALKPKSGAQNALQSIDAPRHIKLIQGKKKCTEVNCDEVSTIETPDSLGEYSQVDNGDSKSSSQSLPSNINVEVTIMVRGTGLATGRVNLMPQSDSNRDFSYQVEFGLEDLV